MTKATSLRKLITSLVVALSLLFLISGKSHAIPVLQLYIEGSTYDTTTNTWTTNSSDFTLWVLGDIGSYGTIEDVALVMAHDSSESGTITLTPTTATPNPLHPSDPSVSPAPVYRNSGIGDQPLMGNGAPLPGHGIYGAGTSWEAWYLGDHSLGYEAPGSDDFYLTDSPMGDFTNGGCPYALSCTYPSMGQINAYQVSVTGYSWVHFDAFNHIILNNNHIKYKFAPPSHDAGTTKVPEPSSILLLGSGLVVLHFMYVSTRRRRRAGSAI